MNFNVNAYAEVGLGYSRPVNDKLTVGGRVKVLLGVAHAEMQVDEFAVDMNIPQNPTILIVGMVHTVVLQRRVRIL